MPQSPAPGTPPIGGPMPQAGGPQVAPGPTLGPNPAPSMGAGAAPFQPSPYVDLSISLPPHWQLVDVAIRNIRSALNSGGFRTTPKVSAAIREVESTLTRLVSAYSASAGRAPEMAAPPAESERGAPGDLSPVSDEPEALGDE